MTSILGPRNLGGILGETFKIYRRNFYRLLAIVAVMQMISMPALFLSFDVLFPAIMAQGKIESVTPFVLNVIISLLCVIVSIVVTGLMQGALIHAVSEQYLRQPIGIGRAYRFVWRRLRALTGGAFLLLGIMGVMMILYLMAGIILPGFRYIFVLVGFCAVIYLLVRWIFVWHAVLLEGLSLIAAFSRSSNLVNGNWWRVLGIMLVMSIITTAIRVILSKIPEVGEIIGSVLSIPVLSIAGTLLYYDLRVRKEEYSFESLVGELHIKPDVRFTKASEDLSNEAFILYQQGQFSEAAKRLQEALKAAENAIGPEHLDVATTLNNLALIYQSQGKYADAQPLYRRSLEIKEKALGSDHPDVAITCENMAKLYRQIGKKDKAKKLEARARKIRLKR